MSEPVKRYSASNGSTWEYNGEPLLFNERLVVDATDYDALEQRRRELEHRIGVLALDLENSNARRDQAERKCDTTRAEVENLRTALAMHDRIERDTNDEAEQLRAEVADLKARLLDAERSDEQLVQLRALLRAAASWMRNGEAPADALLADIDAALDVPR